MTRTEEIIVSGEDFIERRVTVYAQEHDLDRLRASAFKDGYNRGWVRGFLVAIGIVAAGLLGCWLFAQW